MPSKSLGIAILGVNKQVRARLELFLDRHWSSNCLLVSEEKADLCILDLDGLNGKKLLQKQKDHYPNRPLILLSVRDTDIDDITLLRKPLSGNLLKKTIDDLIIKLSQQHSAEEVSTAEPAPISTPEPEPAPQSLEGLKPAVMESKSNERRISLPDSATQARIIRGSCNLIDSVQRNRFPHNNNLYYDPNALLQYTLMNAIEQCRREGRPLRLNLPDDKYISLLPVSNIALTNLNDNKLRPRCLLPIKQQQIRIDHPGENEIALLQAKSEAPQDIDGLLWKVSLWSSRGRLPVGITIDTTIELRQWPNLTRLLAIPQFLRIAALWAKTPLSLNKTAALLNIEARYVCAFFSACYALELTQILSITKDQEVLASNPKKTLAQKGLLQRILRRLRVA